MATLNQEATIISIDKTEHASISDFVINRYGPGGINEGKINYVIDDVNLKVTITRTITNWSV